MAKEKKGSVANKHLHARIAYLQRAATYLAMRSANTNPHDLPSEFDHEPEPADQSSKIVPSQNVPKEKESTVSTPTPFTRPSSGGLPLHLAHHLRQVAQKGTIRIPASVKHAICRTCDTVLLEGHTGRKYTENLSRQGRKAHADVLVLECRSCGTKKRFPVSAERPLRKTRRIQLRVADDGLAATSKTNGVQQGEG